MMLQFDAAILGAVAFLFAGTVQRRWLALGLAIAAGWLIHG